MNCRQFTTCVRDLAEGRISTTLRHEALAHAAACEGCRLLWEEQSALTATLRELAASAPVDAPVRIQAALIAAFRAEMRRDDSVPAPAQPFARRSWVGWAAAAAAVIILSAASVILLPESPAPSRRSTKIRVAAPVLPRPADVPQVSAHTTEAALDLPEPAARMDQAPVIADQPPEAQPPIVALSPEAPIVASDSGQWQTASEFIPLLYGGDPMLLETAPIVRVEVSGAMLQSLGFPIVGEPSPRRIQADLVLGEDGLARAIRFVQ